MQREGKGENNKEKRDSVRACLSVLADFGKKKPRRTKKEEEEENTTKRSRDNNTRCIRRGTLNSKLKPVRALGMLFLFMFCGCRKRRWDGMRRATLGTRLADSSIPWHPRHCRRAWNSCARSLRRFCRSVAPLGAQPQMSKGIGTTAMAAVAATNFVSISNYLHCRCRCCCCFFLFYRCLCRLSLRSNFGSRA